MHIDGGLGIAGQAGRRDQATRPCYTRTENTLGYVPPVVGGRSSVRPPWRT
jgi:hypothetical protein